MLGLLGYGVVRALTGDLPSVRTASQNGRPRHGEEALGLLLVLRAFASGSVALTGTEAVSNGVPSFRPPEARNAKTTLMAMGILFATIFLGISFLASRLGIVPDPEEVESVNSILTRALVGHGGYFYLVQFATSLFADPGRQHRVQRVPAPGVDPGPGSLPTAAVFLPRRPPRLHRRHRFPGV